MKPDEIRPGVTRKFELPVRRPGEAAADADAELASLLEEHARHLMARGMAAGPARAEALRRLKQPMPEAAAILHRSARHREQRMQAHEWLEDFIADLTYAFRPLQRSPSLAVAAILTLALAIGANTAIFSAVSAVMLLPLPFADPGRLVSLWEENPDFHWNQADAAPANVLDWKDQAGGFSGVAGYESFAGSTTLTGLGEPRLLSTAAVTGNFFRVLGVTPLHGRVFQDAETWDTSPRSVVLTYPVWKDVFGADPGLIGKTVELGGWPVEVAGVLPASFAFPGFDAQVWETVRWSPEDRAKVWFRRAHFVRAIGRLKPGVTLDGANAQLQTVVKRLQAEFPVTNTRMGAGLTPLHEFLVGQTRLPLLVMFGGVAVLLLIACANVANLLLVRAAGRERESTVRLALGAGRGRLFRQSLAESAVLAGVGGAAGLAVGWWGTGMLGALQPQGMLPVHDIAMSRNVLLYAFAATVLCAVVFGVAPTVWTMRRVPADVLRDQGRTASGGLRARRWTEALLVTQVALALTLTLGAGLLVRSYRLLQRVNPGFDPSNVLTVSVVLPGIRFDSVSKVLAFYRELEREVRALPGVEAAAITSKVPLGPPSWSSQFSIAGREPMAAGVQVVHRELTPDYFKVMRVPLLRGRPLAESDRRDAPMVVLINQTLARTYFSNQDPVGQRIAFDRLPDSNSTWRTIVGVVGDEHQTALGEASQSEFMAPYPQESRSGMTLVVRTGGRPAGVAPAVRAIIKRLDPKLAITSIQTMDEVRAESLGRDRFLTALMLSFAGVGLVLGMVGIYGVAAQLARRRMREMGIRIALGAKASQVQWLVVRHGLGLTALGIGAGVVITLGAARVIQSLLYQVASADPLTYVVVPALVLATSVAASWLPAARASRADPCQVLRSD